MRLLWLIVVLCVGVPLGAVTIDWKSVDWGEATGIVPNESWMLISQGSEWAIRMSIPKTKLTSGSIKLRDANGAEVERGLFNVTEITTTKTSLDVQVGENVSAESKTLNMGYGFQWFEWRVSADYSKLFAVASNGNGVELASWSSAGLGIVPTEVCLLVSDADVVETALFLQVRASYGGVPEPSAVLLLATLSGLAFLRRSSFCTAFRAGGIAGQ